MDPRIRELLRPEILHTVSGLELIARVVVEGFMSGSNRSQSVGAGQEFSQYRSYQPGDDLRQLDWKMFGRTERYYIKQADIETNITVKFMIDASESMTYAEDGLSKLQFAKILTAALAYLARKQRDTFGLYAINDAQLTVVQPRFEQQQFMRFLNELILLEARGKWQSNQSIEPLFDHHSKEMIVFITDLYDDANDLQRFISRLKTPRNEVIVFQLMGRKESNFGFDGSYTFEDIETGVRTKAETNLLQSTYAVRMNTWLAQTKSWMLEKHLTYHLVYLDEPVDRVLRNFLTVRISLSR
ncbi:MAG TPA: DUF58 domain-containing protein [Cyclobacteriaceae bacterium]|nr:DUF58 domain-containing protein [Cyclobacteriaceae bacterium]